MMARTSWIAMFFVGLCLSRPALADEPASVPPAGQRQVERTVDRAISYLQAESAAWLKQRRCAACHHVAMPLWALSEAARRGYATDQRYVADMAEAALGSRQKMIASGLVSDPSKPPDPRPMGRGVSIGAVFMAVAVRALPSLDEGQKQSVAQIAADAVKKQREDGSWEFFLSRPPINENQGTDAAWILMALQGTAAPDAAQSRRVSLDKGTAWLGRAGAGGTYQEKVLKLLVAIRAGTPRGKMEPAIDELLALQRPDGGWGQMAKMPSDAFATGQTLYVLSLAGCTAGQPQIRRAIEFLVASQKADGSWPMSSRATPDGSPGSAKLLTPITCAASSWATLALVRLAPKKA